MDDMFNVSPAPLRGSVMVTAKSGLAINLYSPEGIGVANRIDEIVNRHADYILNGKPESLNNDAGLTPDIARALHRVVRALHDGNCPSCGLLTDSDAVRSAIHGDWQCPRCKFGFTEAEAIAAMEAFRPFMKANLDVFENWRLARKSTQ